MDFKKLIIENLEGMITESYYQCEEKVGRDIFGDDRTEYEELENKFTNILSTLKEFNIPSNVVDELVTISDGLSTLYARNYFIAGAKEMLKGAFEK